MGLPVAADLEALLAQAGIAPMLPATYTAALAEAVKRWEQATGYVPFVAGSSPTAVSYDITDQGRGTKTVNLRAGIPTSTAVTATLDGTALVFGYEGDCELYPLDAARAGRPYNYLKLSRYAIGRLVVTARWGFCTEDNIPAIASEAILAYAALSLAELDTAKTTSSSNVEDLHIQSADEGDVKHVFATSAAERTRHLQSWQMQWDTAVRQFKRQTL